MIVRHLHSWQRGECQKISKMLHNSIFMTPLGKILNVLRFFFKMAAEHALRNKHRNIIHPSHRLLCSWAILFMELGLCSKIMHVLLMQHFHIILHQARIASLPWRGRRLLGHVHSRPVRPPALVQERDLERDLVEVTFLKVDHPLSHTCHNMVLVPTLDEVNRPSVHNPHIALPLLLCNLHRKVR